MVVGAGSIGLFLQYLLQGPTQSVLYARSHSRDILQNKPLQITGQREGSLKVNVFGKGDLLTLAPDATLFITTKAPEIASVLDELKAHLKGQEAIVLCQNGIGVFDEVRRMLPHARLFRLHCWMGTRRVAVDHVHVAGVYRFELAGAEVDFLNTWQEILLNTGINCTVDSNIHRSEWKKALWNIAVNGIACIANDTNGVVLKYAPLRRIAERLLDEAIQVAALEGIQLTQDDRNSVFSSLEKTSKNINGSLQDLRAGRSSELQYMNGAVVAAAARHGIQAPTNETIFNFVQYLEHSQTRKDTKL